MRYIKLRRLRANVKQVGFPLRSASAALQGFMNLLASSGLFTHIVQLQSCKHVTCGSETLSGDPENLMIQGTGSRAIGKKSDSIPIT